MIKTYVSTALLCLKNFANIPSNFSIFAVEMDLTHTNMTSSFVRSHVFTKLMILAIPSVRMTIYRELRDLGRNNHHSERLQTEY